MGIRVLSVVISELLMGKCFGEFLSGMRGGLFTGVSGLAGQRLFGLAVNVLVVSEWMRMADGRALLTA